MTEGPKILTAALRQQFDAVGERLVLLRLSLGYKKAVDFARALGLEPHTYRMYERSANMPTHEALGRIKELTGASTDWVLYGDTGNLPVSLYKMMYEASEAE